MEDPPQEGKVEVRSPSPKAGATRIDAEKYWAVRHAILKAVPFSDAGLPFRDLPGEVTKRLPGGKIPGGGSVERYTRLVKEDLEVRALIERLGPSNRQRLCRLE